ncbi:StAR-related lipid transfer protein 4, partial [Lemmus lemmus]
GRAGNQLAEARGCRNDEPLFPALGDRLASSGNRLEERREDGRAGPSVSWSCTPRRAEGWPTLVAGESPAGREPPLLKKIKMESLTDVASFSTKLQNTLIQYHSIEEDKWRVAKKMKDVTVWRKPSEEFNGYLYKAQGVMDDTVNNVIDHIRPGPWRLDWDRLMTSLDILEHFEENCCVMRYTTAGQLLNIISPREFVDFSYTVGYEEGLLSCGVSLDWSETRPEFVRGYNHPCGWFCVPLKDNPSQSLLTGYIQTDLRGMIPQSAVDTAMASTLTNFYGDLRKALRKA